MGKIEYSKICLCFFVNHFSYFSDNTPLNLSTKPYLPIPDSTKSFLNYPFASLLSLAQQQYSSLPNHHHQHHHHNTLPSSSPTKDYAYNRRQRERTTFDPHEETPRLLQIFTDTKHPTRYQIASICESLNALPCRKGSHLSFSFLHKVIEFVCFP